MTKKLKLLLLIGCLAAAVAPLHGCGSECGPGTTQKDGQCLLEANGCGGGTRLSDKTCIVDTTGCGENTMLQGQKCVPIPDTCKHGTTFDQSLHECVPDTGVLCAGATRADDDGLCVPTDEVCGEKTTADDSGACVVEAAACGAGTELDPNTGVCTLADAACADGLALDGQTGKCVSTDAVCDVGTAFDADSRLCLPEACQEGDVLVNNICMDAAEKAAANADLTETENNDPALGGAAETLTINPVDGEPFRFTGAIGAPTDVDGDGNVDQDVDAFEFHAAAGDWFQISVQSTGLPAPAFVVSGPDGYTRQSQVAGAARTARSIVAPAKGAYTVSVVASLNLQHEEVGPSGGADWGYVGAIKAITPPSPVDKDPSGGAAELNGDFTDLSDNLFNLTSVSTQRALKLSFEDIGADADGLVQVWSDPTTLYETQPLETGKSMVVGVPTTDTARVLVDWKAVDGPDMSFDISATLTGRHKAATLPDGASESVTVTAAQFDRLVARQTNSAAASLEVSITNAAGDEVASGPLADGEELDYLAFAAGDYVVDITNDTGSSVDIDLVAHARPAEDLGQVGVDTTVNAPTAAMSGGQKRTYVFSASAGQVVALAGDNADGAAADYTVYDPSGTQVAAKSFASAASDDNFSRSDTYWKYLDADKTLVVVVESSTDLTDTTLEVRSTTPTHEGSLGAGGALNFTNTDTIPQGFGGYHLVDFQGTPLFAGVVTPTNGGKPDVFLYDSAMTEVLNANGSGGNVKFTGSVSGAGVYLFRVVCEATCNGYDMSLEGVETDEDLGALSTGTTSSSTLPLFNDGQPFTLSFSVPPGHLFEITHDNDESEYHNVKLFDGSGTLVNENVFFYPLSDGLAESMWHYTASGGQFELKALGKHGSSNEVFNVRVVDPANIGQMSAGASVTANVSTPFAEGEHSFRLVDVSESLNFDGTLSPLATSEELDFRLYDLQMNSVANALGDGGDVALAGAVDASGTYIVAVEAGTDTTGYDLTLNGIKNSEDLGALAAGSSSTATVSSFAEDQSYNVSFEVPAGQVIEISQDNAEGVDHDVTLVDGSGATVASDGYLYPTSDSTPDYLWWYTDSGGPFEVTVKSSDDASNQDIYIRLVDPPNMGQIGAGSTATANVSTSFLNRQSSYRLVDIAEAVNLGGTLAPLAGESVDFRLNDLQNNTVIENEGSGGDVPVSGTIDTPGTYLVAVQAGENVSGYDLTLSGVRSSQDLGVLAADSTNTTSTLSSFSDGQAYHVSFSVPAGQVIELSHDNAESAAHDLYLYDSDGNQLAGGTDIHATSDADPDHPWRYVDSGGDFEVVLRGAAGSTDEQVTIHLATPDDIGQLTVSNPVSATDTTARAAGQSYFKLVEIPAAVSFDGLLSPTGGAELDFGLYELNGGERIIADGNGGDVAFNGDVPMAGTYVVRIHAGAASSGFTLTLNNAVSTVEDLGMIATGTTASSSPLASFDAGATRPYTLSVSAKQVIEFSHDNAAHEAQKFTLYDANGRVVSADAAFETTSASHPDYIYYYSPSGGSYTVVLESKTSVTNEVVDARVFAPTDLGSLQAASPVTHSSSSSGLATGKSDVFLVTLVNSGQVSIDATVPGSQDTDLVVYDSDMNLIDMRTYGTPDDLSGVQLNSGTYVVEFAAYQATPSYDFTATFEPGVGNTSLPIVAIPDGDTVTGVSDTLTVSGCPTIDSLEINLRILHQWRSDLIVDLTSPAGTTVRLWDNAGGSAFNLIGTMPTGLTPAEPLSAFTGESGNGDWTLAVYDSQSLYTGIFESWGVSLTCH